MGRVLPGSAIIAATILLFLAACEQQGRQGPPSTDYAKTSIVSAKPRGGCLSSDEMQAVRNEIAWQQFYDAAIQCRAGTPAFASDYGTFRNKFRADNERNGPALQRAAAKLRVNINTFKTDIANHDGGSAGGNPNYCANAQQGFRWALSPRATTLAQVPPMLDFTGGMGLRSCTAAATPSRK